MLRTGRLLAVIAMLFSGPACAAEQRPILVFAAASLSNVLSDIGRSYESSGEGRITFSFAASMTLARQIEASSGADLFIAADSESMDYVQARNLIDARSRRNLLRNRLVLVGARDWRGMLQIAPRFPLLQALGGGRLALADTGSVPAGRYARAALISLGVWDGVAPRLAEGEDVRAALAYVARGEAPLGIVYATDARVEPRVRVVGTFPENTHPPIVYPAALTRDARAPAASFLAYLGSPAARRAFEAAGFTMFAGDGP
jgi:molybdate transport system substrate-binding protein